mmetsp:Transcript_41526/g.83828  ORF Transcript_41526/g.83828 Transcript_41526/m.83828 type:complete len:157 (-) Transcript_41526:166-636(-)
MLDLQRQLAETAALAEAEAERRLEVQARCEAAERRLQQAEVAREEAQKGTRQAEQLAEEEGRRREESEGLWQQRHAALQRQLRRTEVALGEAHVLGVQMPLAAATSGAGTGSEAAGAAGAGAALAGRQLDSLDSTEILELLREARRRGLGRRDACQ